MHRPVILSCGASIWLSVDCEVRRASAAWVRGVARLTRLPVTEKIEGSNPFAPAIKNPAFRWIFDMWNFYTLVRLS